MEAERGRRAELRSRLRSAGRGGYDIEDPLLEEGRVGCEACTAELGGAQGEGLKRVLIALEKGGDGGCITEVRGVERGWLGLELREGEVFGWHRRAEKV